MRTKIDNLVLFNLCCLIVALAYVWLPSKTVLFVVTGGGIFTLLYSLFLFQQIAHHVESSAKLRLRKRIFLSGMQSLIIITTSVSVLCRC